MRQNQVQRDWIPVAMGLGGLLVAAFAAYMYTAAKEPFATFHRDDVLWALIVPTANVTGSVFLVATVVSQVVRGRLSKWWLLALGIGAPAIVGPSIFCIEGYCRDMETSDCYDCPRAVEDAASHGLVKHPAPQTP
jgi:hypothetical protein